MFMDLPKVSFELLLLPIKCRSLGREISHLPMRVVTTTVQKKEMYRCWIKSLKTVCDYGMRQLSTPCLKVSREVQCFPLMVVVGLPNPNCVREEEVAIQLRSGIRDYESCCMASCRCRCVQLLVVQLHLSYYMYQHLIFFIIFTVWSSLQGQLEPNLVEMFIEMDISECSLWSQKQIL